MRPWRGGGEGTEEADRDAGFAVLAAMIAAAGFACLALEVVETSRAGVVAASADAAHTRMVADAQAGFALAMAALETADPAARWTLGGDPHLLDFEGAALNVRVEDEWGKIPLDTLTADKTRLLFLRAGAAEAEADILVRGFMVARHDVGTAGAQPGRAPGFDSVSDLARIPGLTAGLYAAIAPSVSVAVRDAAFEPRTATPLALEVMTGASPDSPEVIERRREIAGEVPALDTGAPLRLAGRPVTLRVAVRDASGDRLQRAEIVEATRAPDRPFIVRGLVDTPAEPQAASD